MVNGNFLANGNILANGNHIVTGNRMANGNHTANGNFLGSGNFTASANGNSMVNGTVIISYRSTTNSTTNGKHARRGSFWAHQSNSLGQIVLALIPGGQSRRRTY